MLTLRSGTGFFAGFDFVTWQIALYVASVAALGFSAALCGLVMTPAPWLARWSWAQRPKSDFLLWAALAFVAALVITAGAFAAAAIRALTTERPF